jgi:sarcosine oxidase subunit gamma
MSDVKATGAEAASVPTKVVMNQLPGAGIVGQSPLHHADLETVAKNGPKQGGVKFKEQKLMGLLTLRCDAQNPEQAAVAEKVLGVALPTTPLTSVEKGDTSVRWISPDEWLIVVPGNKAFALESAFFADMPGHYSLVNVSGGTTIYQLSGANVKDVLHKSTHVDIHDSEFPVGKVVSTTFAKSSAVIRRTGEQSFELVVRRSFADYLWLWIQDASREFGLVVEA